MQDQAQRKGLDLLQYLGKLQAAAKQPPQLANSNKCGKCLACLQPSLLIPCFAKVHCRGLLRPRWLPVDVHIVDVPRR